MKAVRFYESQTPPKLFDVPVPTVGPGEVLVKIGSAGVCHSDLHVIDWPGVLPYSLPFTLGHEAAGWVAALGPGVTGVRVGDPVAVYGRWGCGLCHNCARGMENYCLRGAERGVSGGGLGRDGAMAEFMLVPSVRYLVPLRTLDPRTAAPLTDAALTPYHAIKRAVAKLRPGTSAVVIGAGGLGHMAVQLLRALSPTRVIAVDVSDEKLELARAVGAHETVHARTGGADGIRRAAGGVGAMLVLDFVGSDDTMRLGASVASPGGDLALIGLGGGQLPLRTSELPWECAVWTSYWGARDELIEVVALAEQGLIQIQVEEFPLDQYATVYDRLRQGQLRGRAVLQPSA